MVERIEELGLKSHVIIGTERTVIAAIGELSPAPVPAAITVPWTRNEHGATAGLKTTSYAENVRALHAAQEAGADEALFANTAGELCEGTGANVLGDPRLAGISPGLRGVPLETIGDWVSSTRNALASIARILDDVYTEVAR